MPATPLPPPPASPPRRRARPQNPPRAGRRDRLALAVEILAAMAGLPPTPEVAELAAATGRTPAELGVALDAMERAGLVERWPDPSRAGAARVMLSARSLARLGLRLAPRGDRWNPDRPPVYTKGL